MNNGINDVAVVQYLVLIVPWEEEMLKSFYACIYADIFPENNFTIFFQDIGNCQDLMLIYN